MIGEQNIYSATGRTLSETERHCGIIVGPLAAEGPWQQIETSSSATPWQQWDLWQQRDPWQQRDHWQQWGLWQQWDPLAAVGPLAPEGPLRGENY